MLREERLPGSTDGVHISGDLPEEGVVFAVGVALREAVHQGKMEDATMVGVLARTGELYEALTRGKFISVVNGIVNIMEEIPHG